MNLVIGNTSQLAHYFPDEGYEKISSRNIDLTKYNDKFYDRIYFCFAEQRTYLEDQDPFIFYDINADYTFDLINFFSKKCNKIIVYGTAELWNNIEGPISIKYNYDYCKTSYIHSKQDMCDVINRLRADYNTAYQNIIILHPVNFNSIYRKSGFLFGKIFDSIINKKRIEIGDTYFYRDLIHPKYVVERSIIAEEDEIIGSGRLVFVNDFIRDLYKSAYMDYDDYVIENYDYNLKIKRRINYAENRKIRYTDLLKDTLHDLGI